MFSVDFDPGRNPEKGQFYVKLMVPDDPLEPGKDVAKQDQLGYWCDKGHLQSFARSIEHAIQRESTHSRTFAEWTVATELLRNIGAIPHPINYEIEVALKHIDQIREELHLS